MAVYKYRAKTSQGDLVEGIVEAENEGVARDLIKEQGILLLKLDLQQSQISSLRLFYLKVKKKDLVIFSRQLSVMISGNIPIVKALQIISAQTENIKFQNYVNQITMEVETGVSLSDALGKFSDVFDSFYINMIKSGETSGRLDEVLTYLADQLEKDYDLFRKVKGALIYPLLVVGSMTIAGIIMVTYVIPKLANIFISMGAEIPWTTRALLSLSQIIITYWYIFAVAIVSLAVFIRFYNSTHLGRRFFSKIKFKIPVLGKLYKEIYVFRFTRSLSTLLVGGVNLIDSLRITADVVEDPIFKDYIEKTIGEVQDGNSIVSVFSKSKFIPAMLSNMMYIGEQTGKLDYILQKIGDFYGREIDASTNKIMTLLEPLIMVVLGLGVAVMVSAIYLPMYSLPTF